MSDIQNQKVASAVLLSRIDQHVSESNYRQFAYDCALQAATITRAELEAVLRECREALVVCKERMVCEPYAVTLKAIAKIDEVLAK